MNPEHNNKRKEKVHMAFWLVVFVVIGIYISSTSFSLFRDKDISPGTNLALVSESNKEGNALRKYSYVNKDLIGSPKVSAKAFIVGDLKTGEIILAKNEESKFPIASTSKLMTALVTKELSTPTDVVKVSSRALATYGTNGGLRLGEKIKTLDLVYPMLL